MYRLAVLILAFSFATFAQTGKHTKAKSSRAAANLEAAFARRAAQATRPEVRLGKLAQQNAQSDDVKKFGQRMVDDHGKAEQDLEGVASKANITLPTEVNAQQKAEQQRMEKLNGAAFDRAYMAMMVKDHTKDVAEFKKEANSTSANADLKDYANRTYPTLEDHLTNAKAVDNALPKSANSKSGKKSPAKPTSGETTGGPGLLLI